MFNRLIVLVKKGLYATDEGDVSGCEHTMLVFGSFHGFIDHLSWLNACPKGVHSLRFLHHKTGWTQFLLLLCLNLWPFFFIFLATGQSLWPPHVNLYTVQLFYQEYKWDMIQTLAHRRVKNDEHLKGIEAALLQVSGFTNKRLNCTQTVMVQRL